MKLFLKMKHWQLFGLLAATYFASQIAGTTTVVASENEIKQIVEHNFLIFKTTTVISSQEIEREVSTDIPEWEESEEVTKHSLISILFIVVLLGWFYAVCVNLNQKLPDTVKMNLKKFKWLFFTPIIGMFLFYTFVYVVLFENVSKGIELNLGIFALIIPLYLFSMCCLFYCIYFNAKSFKAVELQHSVTFGDYVWEFLLFLFFPIGVWLLQPRINKIFIETTVCNQKETV